WTLYALAVYAILHCGFGKHIAAVMLMDPSGRILEKGELVIEWLGELVYVLLITIVKCSVLSMYRRIFPTRVVQLGTMVLGVIVAMWFLATTLAFIFQCFPVSKAWNPAITTGSCIDKEKFFLGNSIPNILTDLAILCLPVYEVYHLQIIKARKIGLLFVFLLGGLVVIISIVRLKVLIDIAREGLAADYTVEINGANIWTVVEPSIGMVSASLPTLRPAIAILGKVFGISSSGSKDNAQKKSDSQHTVVTIGGSGKSRKATRAKGSGITTTTSDVQGSFERLTDEHGQEDSSLWPPGYENKRDTRVTSKGPEGYVTDIPLKRIAVKHDIDWIETRNADATS
ncbi:uncharacterized protein LY89DRAFT_577423, partial [Mollisia scopiformis]